MWPDREHTLPGGLIMPGVAEHHHHSHTPSDASAARLRIALGLLLGLMVLEVTAGVLAHSLALISDAAHMLTDAGALALALLALRLAARPAARAMEVRFCPPETPP